MTVCIHISIHTYTQYLEVQNPQHYEKTYTSAVKAFVRAAVLAYECGYTEDTIRRHLQQQVVGQEKAVGEEAQDDALSLSQQQQDVGEEDESTTLCWRLIALVWVTCHLSPVSVRRWCSGIYDGGYSYSLLLVYIIILRCVFSFYHFLCHHHLNTHTSSSHIHMRTHTHTHEIAHTWDNKHMGQHTHGTNPPTTHRCTRHRRHPQLLAQFCKHDSQWLL